MFFATRFPRFDADHLMRCTLIAEFPQGADCFCSCCFLCGPTIGEFPGSVGHGFARAIQFALQTVLVLFGLVQSSSVTSEATGKSTSPSSCSDVTFFMEASKALYSSAKASGPCIVLWFMSEALSFVSSFFLWGGTEATFSVVQQTMEFPSLDFIASLSP